MSKKTIFISGNFYILHPGIIRFIDYSAKLGDHLIIGIFNNSINDYNFTLHDRIDALNKLNIKKEIIIINDNLDSIILDIKPDIIVKGNEYRNKKNIEEDLINQYGGKLIFSSGSSFSSSSLFDIIQKTDISIDKANDYCNRHLIDKLKVKDVVSKFRDLNILVIGDLIIDEYIDCSAIGMSREDPSVVFAEKDKKNFIGGAGIVSLHAASLGANVSYIYIKGNDNWNDYANKAFKNYNVKTYSVDDDRPTVHKKRYICENKTLFKLNTFDDRFIDQNIENQIIKIFSTIKKDIDLVIFSDFNYGLLTQSLIDSIILMSHENNIKVVSDCQSSSQNGNIGKYKNTFLSTPTEYEARYSMNNFDKGIESVMESFVKFTNVNHLIMKLGKEGCLISSYDPKKNRLLSDQLPALNSNPIDISGAGDSLFITCSMSLALGENIWTSAFLGSVAAGIQVSRLGNIPLKIEDFE